MTYKSFEHFALLAYKSGLECTLEEICRFEEFSSMGVIAACIRISELLEGYGLSISPPVSEGGLDQVRVVEKCEGGTIFESQMVISIENGEGHSTEFKESLYCKKAVLKKEGIPENQKFGDEIVFSSIKAICAFANSDGGTLLVGVNDNGLVEGIEADFPYLPGSAKDLDSWLLFLRACIEKFIYDARSFMPFIKVGVVRNSDVHVAVIIVRPRRNRLVVSRSLKSREDECVFLRMGASNVEVRARAIEDICLGRVKPSNQ